ncbi:hypothetical protein SUGI_1006880 [Cryptomeria japonica]|nr:hypothetical protein SUGI_1006880 [Cryptomeria japonica]
MGSDLKEAHSGAPPPECPVQGEIPRPLEQNNVILVSFLPIISTETNLNFIVDMRSSQENLGQLNSSSSEASHLDSPSGIGPEAEDPNPFIEAISKNHRRSSPSSSVGVASGSVVVKTRNSCCGKDGRRHGYRCAACKFYLKITCATVRMAEERPIQHPSHPEHFLSYVRYPYGFHGANGIWVQFQKRPPGESQMRCSDCAQIVSGFGYYCLSGSCGYALHPTCALLLRPQTQVEVAPTRPTQVETPPPPPEKHHHHRGAAMAFRGVKFLGKLAVGAITGDPTSIGGALADLFLSD